jgi:hypothetical protein
MSKPALVRVRLALACVALAAASASASVAAPRLVNPCLSAPFRGQPFCDASLPHAARIVDMHVVFRLSPNAPPSSDTHKNSQSAVARMFTSLTHPTVNSSHFISSQSRAADPRRKDWRARHRDTRARLDRSARIQLLVGGYSWNFSRAGRPARAILYKFRVPHHHGCVARTSMLWKFLARLSNLKDIRIALSSLGPPVLIPQPCRSIAVCGPRPARRLVARHARR